MEITAIVIGVLLATVLSNVMNNVFPRLPLPLLQIAFGSLLGLTFLRGVLELEPEIFMIMVIAPLLFHEADETNMLSLWKVRKQVFLMAFMLVFVTVLAIGIVTDLILPIPLAACFALGAILGPTDAVAVMSLSSQIKFGGDIKNILMGEGLINDASGIIAFRFAVAARLTGTFSLGDAFIRLVIVAVGGLVVGLIISSVEHSAVKTLRRLSVRHTATYVMIELMMPFICYMVAEMIGVSGVLAAVAAGSRQTPRIRQAKRLEAEFGAAKQTVWEMVTFGLNSMVFLLLGLQLPHILTSVWGNSDYSHTFLLIVVVLVSLILLSVRLASVLVLAWKVTGSTTRERLRNSLVLTLSGVKGTVSLATAFALPAIAIFPERNLLLFITAGVIMFTLLVALALLPLVADSAEKSDSPNRVRVDIIRETINQLQEQEQPPADSVIVNLKKRIKELEIAEFSKKERSILKDLKIHMYRVELAAIKEMKQEGEISERTYNGAKELLYVIYKPGFKILTVKSVVWFTWMNISRHREWVKALMPVKEHMRNLTDVFQNTLVLVEDFLNSERVKCPEKIINRLIDEREELSEGMTRGIAKKRFAQGFDINYEKDMLNSFYVERRVIHQFMTSEKITPEEANEMRVDVNGLESYILSGHRSDIAADINALVSKWRPESGNLSE